MATQLRQFVDNLEQIVARSKSEKALSMARGSIASMEAYHRQCGRLEGMDATVGLAKDMLNKMLSSDDGDELPEMTGGDS